jgi:hypothetical protein
MNISVIDKRVIIKTDMYSIDITLNKDHPGINIERIPQFESIPESPKYPYGCTPGYPSGYPPGFNPEFTSEFTSEFSSGYSSGFSSGLDRLDQSFTSAHTQPPRQIQLSRQIQLFEQTQEPDPRSRKRNLSEIDNTLITPRKKNTSELIESFENFVKSIVKDKIKKLENLKENIKMHNINDAFSIIINLSEHFIHNKDIINKHYNSFYFRNMINIYVNDLIDSNKTKGLLIVNCYYFDNFGDKSMLKLKVCQNTSDYNCYNHSF